MPHLTAGFDDNGDPVARSGYMVACRKHSDCYPCGRHPLTGQFFQCQKRHTLYDTVHTQGGDSAIVTVDNGISFLNVTSASASAFDPDMEEAVHTGKVGVCVDIDSSMNEGCGNEIMASIKDGMVGCFDNEWTGKFLCGLSLNIKHGDISTVQTEGNLFWPRVLLNGSEDTDGDGRGGQRMECYDPIDCTQKCRYLARTSRHGFGTPPACAMYAPSLHCSLSDRDTFHHTDHLALPSPLRCDQYCSSNLATTIMDIRTALWDDILTVGRLIAMCFGNHGIAGCICQFALTLQPAWRRVANPSTEAGRKIRCENEDPWQLLLAQLDTAIIDWQENSINWLIGGINDLLEDLPWPLSYIGRPIHEPFCMPNPHVPDKCMNPPWLRDLYESHFSDCENSAKRGGLDMMVRYPAT